MLFSHNEVYEVSMSSPLNLFIFFAKSSTNIGFKWDPTGDSAVNGCHYKLEAKQGGIKSHCRYFNNVIYIASFL